MRAGARPADRWVSGSRASESRSPGSTPPARREPRAPEANESAAAAVSCFVAQVRGRVGAAPLHAGFPGTLPLAPLAALRRCLAPPRLLTKGFRVAIRRPDRPPRHLAAASPGGRRRRCFEAQPGGAAARARVCVCAALLWRCLAPEQRKTRRGAPAARRLGSPRGSGRARPAPSAQARAITHLPPWGPWGAQRSPRPSAPTQPARPGSPGRKVT